MSVTSAASPALVFAAPAEPSDSHDGARSDSHLGSRKRDPSDVGRPNSKKSRREGGCLSWAKRITDLKEDLRRILSADGDGAQTGGCGLSPGAAVGTSVDAALNVPDVDREPGPLGGAALGPYQRPAPEPHAYPTRMPGPEAEAPPTNPASPGAAAGTAQPTGPEGAGRRTAADAADDEAAGPGAADALFRSPISFFSGLVFHFPPPPAPLRMTVSELWAQLYGAQVVQDRDRGDVTHVIVGPHGDAFSEARSADGRGSDGPGPGAGPRAESCPVPSTTTAPHHRPPTRPTPQVVSHEWLEMCCRQKARVPERDYLYPAHGTNAASDTPDLVFNVVGSALLLTPESDQDVGVPRVLSMASEASDSVAIPAPHAPPSPKAGAHPTQPRSPDAPVAEAARASGPAGSGRPGRCSLGSTSV